MNSTRNEETSPGSNHVVPASFLCPLTLGVMAEPVCDREGNSYERSAILEWLQASRVSPLTRQPLEASDLVPNRVLRDAIEEFQCTIRASESLNDSNDQGTARALLGSRKIAKITVRAGNIVDGISIAYSNADARDFGGMGGNGESISLDRGEGIDKVCVRYGKLVQCLTFRTNKGRQLGPCGGAGGLFLGGMGGKDLTVKAPKGYVLVGVHGRAGKYLDAIGFHWGPLASAEGEESDGGKELLKSTECHGGGGGEKFDDRLGKLRPSATTAKSGWKQVTSFVGIGVGSIDIVLTQPQHQLGDSMTGVLKLALTEPVKANRLVIVLIGTRRRKGVRVHEGKTSTTENTETVYSCAFELAGEKAYSSGDHPFTLDLPSKIDEETKMVGIFGDSLRVIQSLHSMTASPTRWELQAFLDIPWKRNLSKRRPLAVAVH